MCVCRIRRAISRKKNLRSAKQNWENTHLEVNLGNKIVPKEAVELIQSNKDDEHKFPHTKLDSLGTRYMPTADADAVVDADK